MILTLRLSSNVGLKMRQTQPGNVQADNPFLLTARLDTGVASGIVGFPTPPRPSRKLEFPRHVTMATLEEGNR